MQYKFLRFPGGKTKVVTFSYDDGFRSDIRLADTLTKYEMKGTFNLNGSKFREFLSGKSLSIEEIQTYLLDAGHEIAVHGELHKALGLCNPLDGIREVLNCRLELEKTFGRIIRGMAYADSGIRTIHLGTNYEKIKQYLCDLSIVYSRTLGEDNNSFSLPQDWYAWMPTVHHDNPKALEYAQEFVKIGVAKQYCSSKSVRMFYVWGHSYEFEHKNNWDHLEKLCETLAGHEDVWYATNIEIYDYVNAFYSLIFSADSTMVYNPTLLKIWFQIDNQEYVVEPGQTLKLL